MKNHFYHLFVFFIALLISTSNVLAKRYYNDHHKHRRIIHSIPATGPNSFCGEPVWRLPAPFPPDFNIRHVAEYRENDTQNQGPILLTNENCVDDTVLATTADPQFYESQGIAAPDPRLENIRLKEVPFIVGFSGRRRFLDLENKSDNPLPIQRTVASMRGGPITLGMWTKARGRLSISCHKNHTKLKFRFKNLLPTGQYSLWAIWLPGLVPLPLGGVPNVMEVDEKGHGTFNRTLRGCPYMPTSDGSELMWITLAHHSDSAIYAGSPDIGFTEATFEMLDGTELKSTMPLGILHQDQLFFPLRILDHQ